MRPVIILHHEEIALKGKNQHMFVQQLVQNLQQKIDKKELKGKVRQIFNRYQIFPEKIETEEQQNTWSEVLSTTFGVKNFSFGEEVTWNDNAESEKLLKDAVKKVVVDFQENFGEFLSFRVTTKRADKNYPVVSMEMNRMIGGCVLRNFGPKKVKMKGADAEIFVEILGKKAFIYINKHEGAGGLPVSCSGKALVLLSGGIDSPVASYMMQKRGMRTDFIHFHSYPQTSKKSVDKVRALAESLTKFSPKYKLLMCPFLDTQKVILKNIPDRFRIIMYRRLMLRIAYKMAKKMGYSCVITGESLGQVASQTIENMSTIGEVLPSQFPILKPLIAFDKYEIINLAKKIGTFDISIRPHEDCCTVYMPKQPETRSKVIDVLKEEEKLDIDQLVDNAIEGIELEKIG